MDHPGFADRLHPGYVGNKELLNEVLEMDRDGLCTYHCIAAATDCTTYCNASTANRAALADDLRRVTIRLLDEDGLKSQARRLERSGYDGYPDEEDFLYLASASGVTFEIC